METVFLTSEPRIDYKIEEIKTLVEFAQKGDQRAFEEIYTRLKPQIMSYVISKTHSSPKIRSEQEDICATAFMRAWKNISRYVYRGISFEAWLTTIARNLIWDHFKAARHSKEFSTGEIGMRDDETRVIHSRSRESTLPELSALTKERDAELRQALAKLGTDHRLVLELRYFRGYTNQEVAEKLGITAGAVKSQVYRAIQKLREYLDPQYFQ